MKSEQRRQRRRERKRLEREEKRRSLQDSPGMTRVELRRKLETDSQAQMCASREAQMCAPGDFEVIMPRRVERLFWEAVRTARRVVGSPISPGECLVRMAEHYIAAKAR